MWHSIFWTTICAKTSQILVKFDISSGRTFNHEIGNKLQRCKLDFLLSSEWLLTVHVYAVCLLSFSSADPSPPKNSQYLFPIRHLKILLNIHTPQFNRTQINYWLLIASGLVLLYLSTTSTHHRNDKVLGSDTHMLTVVEVQSILPTGSPQQSGACD